MMHKHRIPHLAALLVAFALVSPDLRAQGATVDEASPAQLKTAKAAYDLGLEAMSAEKYSEALQQFKESYATVSSPNSLLMVGRVLVKLGRLPEGYDELKRTLRQAKQLSATQAKYQKTVSSAQSDLDDLQSKIALVIVPKGATAKIKDNTVGPSEEEETVAVMPGTISIEATFADGSAQASEDVYLRAGKSLKLAPPKKAAAPKKKDRSVSAEPDETETETASAGGGDLGMSRKTLGYIVGGVGAFGVATFVGVGLLGASIYGDTKKNCSNSRCPEAAVDNQGSKSLFQGIGYAGLGMGLAGLGIGAWLVFGGDEKTEPSTAINVGPGMVQLNHSF